MSVCMRRNFVPSVIEPSFGVGRIIYCMFEHCYATRKGDEKRSLFHFKPVVAPVKATVFPLFAQPNFIDQAQAVAALLTAAGLSNIVDSTGASIGKRYARTDEIGVPFAVTVDHQTLEDSTVTVRDRDSTTQVGSLWLTRMQLMSRLQRPSSSQSLPATSRELLFMKLVWSHC